MHNILNNKKLILLIFHFFLVNLKISVCSSSIVRRSLKNSFQILLVLDGGILNRNRKMNKTITKKHKYAIIFLQNENYPLKQQQKVYNKYAPIIGHDPELTLVEFRQNLIRYLEQLGIELNLG